MCKMKSPIRAAQKKQSVRMRPAGRQFDMPGLEVLETVQKEKKIRLQHWINKA